MILKLPLNGEAVKSVYPWCIGQKKTAYFSTFNNRGVKIKILLFHGSEDPGENAQIAQKLQGIPCDFYLSCFGNLFPEAVKSRHIMPRNTSILVSLKKTQDGEYYLTVSDE